MLFRTVFGPELEAIHGFTLKQGSISLTSLQRWFVQEEVTATQGTNLEEAVAFLLTLGLLQRDPDHHELHATLLHDFRLGVLERLRLISEAPAEDAHPLDPWFHRVLEQCFIRPNHSFIGDLHLAVNDQTLPVPCSEEKATAWRRVMEFLGCGRRVGTGFLVAYQANLVHAILRRWAVEGSLENCLRFVERYLPAFTATGDLSSAMAQPLQYLEVRGQIRLTARGDFAGRAYFGDRRVKWIVVGG